MVVPVKIDPKNEQIMVIDPGGAVQQNTAPGYSTTQVNALQDELMAVQQQQDGLRLTGRSSRAVIKKYNWLGVYVNGNNPYAELEIEVLPDDAPAFEGKVKGAISEQSLEKYQPGKEIFVKYDPNDHSKLALDHS
jgi:hypothetical protein